MQNVALKLTSVRVLHFASMEKNVKLQNYDGGGGGGGGGGAGSGGLFCEIDL